MKNAQTAMPAVSSASSGPARWRRQRRKRLFLAVCALVFLAAATAGLLASSRQLQEARLDAAMARRAFDEAILRRDEAQSRAELEDAARQLAQLAAARRATPRHWAKRLVDLRQRQLGRDEANTFFSSLARTEERLFHAEAFDLAVTGDDAGLFDLSEKNAPLSVTVRGTLIFHAGEELP
jgi:hypothetical protein